MKVVSFVAATSNSGKTTLIEKIVAILKSRGMRVAVVKHASAGFDLDKPGKDSWRFQQVGANPVVLVGPGKIVMMKNIDHEPSSADIARIVGDVDIMIHEGFKRNAENKIEVFRYGFSGSRPLSLDDTSFLALVSDKPFDVRIPRFDLNDAEGIADFLLKKSAALC